MVRQMRLLLFLFAMVKRNIGRVLEVFLTQTIEPNGNWEEVCVFANYSLNFQLSDHSPMNIKKLSPPGLSPGQQPLLGVHIYLGIHKGKRK